jgi:GAF domain-containing protein
MACLASLYVAHELEQQRRHRHHAEDEERKSASALRDEIAVAESSAEAARELLAGGGIAQVLGTLCRLEARLLGCDATYTFLRDTHDAKSFAVVASNGDGGSSLTSRRALRIPDVVLARMIDRLGRDQPLVIAGERDMLPVDGTVCIYTALMAGRDVAGIQVAVRREARPFTSSDVELARRLTHTASAALAQARNAEAWTVEANARDLSQPDVGERVWVELQTPLASILRLAEHAADLSLPAAERRALLMRIASTTRDMLHMLERLDRASRPSGGRSARG